MLLTQTSQKDYEDLCHLVILKLADTAEPDQSAVYCEFKKQLSRSPSGWYETGLPCRGNHAPLPSSEVGSIHRLESLVRRLKRKNLTYDYDAVIEQQREQGIVEPANDKPIGKEYLFLIRKMYVSHLSRRSCESYMMRRQRLLLIAHP